MSLTILEEPGEMSLSRNPVRIAVNTSLGNAAGVKIELGVYVETIAFSGNFSKLYAEDLTPDTNGNVVFQLEKYFDDALDWFMPEWSKPMGRVAEGVRQFYYEVIEYNNGSILSNYNPWAGGPGTPFKIIYKGGVPKEQWRKNYFFSHFITGNNAGLSNWWQYDIKYLPVGLYQPYWLMMQCRNATGYANPQLVTTVYWNDGTNTVVSTNVPELKTGATFKSAYGGLYYFAVGIDQLQLEALSSTKQIDYYTVELNDGGTQIGSRAWFKAIYELSSKDRALLVNNSLGGVETVRYFYQEQTGIQLDESRGESITDDIGNGRIIGKQFFSNSIQEQVKRVGNTGNLSKQIIDHYRQVLLAENIYEIIRSTPSAPIGIGNRGVRFIPIQRDSMKIALRIKNEDSVINSMVMEYSLALKNSSYAPENLDTNLFRMDAGYGYSFTFPALPTGDAYYISAWPGFFSPSPSGIDFNSKETLLLWVIGNWGTFGYWSIDMDGNLQLDSDVNYGTLAATAVFIQTH